MSTNPAITFSGLGSGIDTASIIQALMRIERMPIDRIEGDKTRIKQKQGVVQEINGLLGKLRDAAAKMYGADALAGRTATSADPTVVTGNAGTTAANGTYNVVVNALAQTHTLASDASPQLQTGRVLDITMGGTTSSVTIQSGDTLQTFADRVNAEAGALVSASVVNDRLVLISRESGAAGAVTIGGNAAGRFNMATTQAAQDASATVNGVAVTGSGNTIEGAINGLSLTLAKVGSTTVTVGADTGAATATAQAFVDAYNAVVSNVRKATAYDAATKTAGTLQGDSSISSLGGQLRGIAGAAVPGLGGAYDSLAQIGITSSRDGTLTLDQTAFSAALKADPAAVAAVFGSESGDGVNGPGDGVARQIQAFASSFSSDILSARLTGFTSSLQRLDDRISGLEAMMELKEKRLRAQWTAMETAVSQFQSQGADLAARLASLR